MKKKWVVIFLGAQLRYGIASNVGGEDAPQLELWCSGCELPRAIDMASIMNGEVLKQARSNPLKIR